MMKILLVVIFLFFVDKANTQTDVDFLFILKYLNKHNIKLCYSFSCWSKHQNKNLFNFLEKANIRISFPKSTNNINHSLKEKGTITYYAYILDLTCEKFNITFLRKNIDKYAMRLTHPWLIFTQPSVPSYWKQVFSNVKIRMDSNVKLAVQSKNKTLQIYDIYNPASQIGKQPILFKYAFWNGFELNLINYNLYRKRKNMTYIELRSGSVVLIPNHQGTFEEYMTDTRHTQFDTMSKFHYPLFLLLEEVHNFTHTVQIEDKWFGNYQNGTDDGVGKLLYEGKIDITCTGASQRPPRVDVYDYLMPSYHFRPCYIFRNPGTYNPLSDEFLKPFASNVWYTILAIAIVISILLKLFYNTERKFVESDITYSWTAAVLTTLSIIFQQDASIFPTGSAGRTTFLVLQIWAILLYNYYTSSVISSLLSKPPDAFHSLDELGRSQLDIGIEDLPYTLTWFEIMNDSDVQYIYKHKVFPSGAKRLNIYEPEEGIAKVREGGFAYHTQLDTGYPIIARTFDQDAICDLTEISMIPQVEAGMMVQKKSQYKEFFHVSLRRIKEIGLVHRISQIWEAKKPECLSSARVMAVGFNQIFIAFLTLFIGILLSLFILIIELFWFKFKLQSRIKTNLKNLTYPEISC